jgi:hypothetical protein
MGNKTSVLIPPAPKSQIEVGFASGGDDGIREVVEEANRVAREEFPQGTLSREIEINKAGKVCFTPIYGTILFNQVARQRGIGYVSTIAEKERALDLEDPLDHKEE